MVPALTIEEISQPPINVPMMPATTRKNRKRHSGKCGRQFFAVVESDPNVVCGGDISTPQQSRRSGPAGVHHKLLRCNHARRVSRQEHHHMRDVCAQDAPRDAMVQIHVAFSRFVQP